MTSTTYHVTGMTCEHCSRAVRAELSALDGVAGVTVDLVPGGASAVTVESTALLGDEEVAAALDEAGDYRLVSPGADGLSRGRSGAAVAPAPVGRHGASGKLGELGRG